MRADVGVADSSQTKAPGPDGRFSRVPSATFSVDDPTEAICVVHSCAGRQTREVRLQLRATFLDACHAIARAPMTTSAFASRANASVTEAAQVLSVLERAGFLVALGGLGALRHGGGALASYLLFEPGFVGALMKLGEQDAFAHKEALLSFFGVSEVAVSAA